MEPALPTPLTSALRMTFTSRPSVGGERQKRDDARALHRRGQRALVPRAAARDAARQDLASLRHELAQARRVLVVDMFDLVDAERTDLALRLAVFGDAFLQFRSCWHRSSLSVL